MIEGKSFSTRPQRGIIGEVSGNNPDSLQLDNWQTFRMAKLKKATDQSKSVRHGGRLLQAVVLSASSKVAKPVLQIPAAVLKSLIAHLDAERPAPARAVLRRFQDCPPAARLVRPLLQHRRAELPPDSRAPPANAKPPPDERPAAAASAFGAHFTYNQGKPCQRLTIFPR